ncbi:HEAT repeat domain-containing protein [Hymenobacter weizhouensis]|uniref:HEAT repeat domain-containing protein n=1 Tax=Hymenobacter sp. YIM 151500-1 TaxID=2987689 RepID=UPI002226360F|nr:HEAT repeat domain-containing protein [Hymenobacter sp. YIM 151500-1]UYZ62826.1 HEAT repeat domain-containing protein [Hymenobacter sp. YIM 151500-1]
MSASPETAVPLSPDCAALVPLLAAYADGTLAPAEAAAVAAHLPQCLACSQQLTQLRQLLRDLDDVPAPVPPLALRDNFLASLAQEKAALADAAAPAASLNFSPSSSPPSTQEAKVVPLWEASPAGQWLRIAAAVALLAVGAVLGLLLRPVAQPEVATRPAPAAELAAQLTSASGQPATASRRLRLVSEAPATVQPGDPAVQVLITTLNADPSPNVRLAAAEALYHLRADPRVGPALVQALPNQTDPNVQITLIELLVALRDKRAVAPLEQLARQPQVLPAVRQQAERGLSLLI